MEYAFPPLPPEYARLMIARWLCVGWNLFGLYWLVRRVRRRKEVQVIDAAWWYIGAVVGMILVALGTSRRAWVSNDWLEPLGAATISLAIAGTTLSLIKLYEERRWREIFGTLVLYGMSLFLLLNPSMGCSSPESYRRTQCKNNLKQIGLALHNYHDTHSSFPASASNEPLRSWRVDILPYLDKEALSKSYDTSAEWDGDSNTRFARQKLIEYVCPTNAYPKDDTGRWYTAYSMPTGPHTVGDAAAGADIRTITDGTSNTLLVVEACGAQIIWTEPRDVHVTTQPTGINLKGAKPQQSAGWMSSYHVHGANVLMGDGSVRFLSRKLDPTVLKQLATKDGGEEVGDF